MWTILSESLIIGFITYVIGTIIFNLSINKLNKDKPNKPYGVDSAFFMTGVILHLLLEFGGFNKWYCDKKTMCGYRNLSKI